MKREEEGRKGKERRDRDPRAGAGAGLSGIWEKMRGPQSHGAGSEGVSLPASIVGVGAAWLTCGLFDDDAFQQLVRAAGNSPQAASATHPTSRKP
jgi:hypothetical protein